MLVTAFVAGWKMLFQAPYRMTWGNATCYVFQHLGVALSRSDAVFSVREISHVQNVFFLAGKSPKLRGLYCKLAGKINGTYRETMGNLSINGGFNGKIHYE